MSFPQSEINMTKRTERSITTELRRSTSPDHIPFSTPADTYNRTDAPRVLEDPRTLLQCAQRCPSCYNVPRRQCGRASS